MEEPLFGLYFIQYQTILNIRRFFASTIKGGHWKDMLLDHQLNKNEYRSVLHACKNVLMYVALLIMKVVM